MSGTTNADPSTLPVAIVHFERRSFSLKYALRSAERHTGAAVLIGDESNAAAWHRHWNCAPVVSRKFEQFRETYVHRSTNSTHFELSCFRRFFLLEEWMVATGTDRTCLLDSDVVVCSNLSADLAALSGDCAAGLMRPSDQGPMQWVASPHVSYWTRAGLADFTQFCLRANTDPELVAQLDRKYRWHIENNKSGGICDMTYLYLWAQGRDDIRSFCGVFDGRTVDFNINTSLNNLDDEYETIWGVKRFRFREDRPFARNRILGEDIRFLAIHCQARNKLISAFLYHPALRGVYWTVKPGYVAVRSAVHFARSLRSLLPAGRKAR